jgi:hypothetical protein
VAITWVLDGLLFRRWRSIALLLAITYRVVAGGRNGKGLTVRPEVEGPSDSDLVTSASCAIAMEYLEVRSVRLQE